MPIDIRISDERHRDARVSLEGVRRPPSRRFVAAGAQGVAYTTLVKVPEGLQYPQLVAAHGSDAALADALIAADPELDLELTGRRVGPVDRVWVRPDGSILYTGRVLEVIFGPDGEQRARRDFVDVEATVDEESPLPWSGKLYARSEVVRRFVLGRKQRLRHVDGLTYEFLFELAKHLEDRDSVLLVGTGPRGQKPLIFQRNGAPYRGFLEGRTDGDGYLLVLHLSHMELKRPAGKPDATPEGGAA